MKYETVQKDKTPRSGNTQMVTGEEQRTHMNSIVANDTVRPKPNGHLGAAAHRSKQKYSAAQHIQLEHKI